MDYFAGLDISMDETHVCVLDREGMVVRESKAESTAQAVANELAKAPSCRCIVFETGQTSVQEAYEAAVGNRKAYEQHFELGGYMSKFEKWNDTLASLTPHTPQQTELLSSIRSISASFQQTRLLMSEQLASSISWPLLVIVVCVGASVVLRLRR